MPFKNKNVKAEIWKAMAVKFHPFPVQCQFCGVKKELTLDHIIDTCAGGSDEINNIQVLCSICHIMKNNIKQMRMRERILHAKEK